MIYLSQSHQSYKTLLNHFSLVLKVPVYNYIFAIRCIRISLESPSLGNLQLSCLEKKSCGVIDSGYFYF